MLEQLGKDPWFVAIGTFQFLASVSALIFLIARWRRNGVLLQYEPRRPVPWGVVGALLAVAFTAVSILAALTASPETREVAAPSQHEQVLSLAASIVMQSLGPILLLCIAASTNATWSDLGLPSRSAAAWGRDVAIGVITCLAAIVPVGLVNAAARAVLKMPDELTKHPLVEMLTNSTPDFMVLVLSTVMAVVIAPIAEEITFRLLLQGWLEKWEDRRLGWRNVVPADSPTSEAATVDSGLEAQPEAIVDDYPVVQVPIALEPPRTGIGGLPYGWAPIILSSLLFAVAHYGYGPEPVPLFVLAIFLGYCYQRTHRIIPCIVAHGLFNLLSMIALWRVVFLAQN